MQGCRRGRTAGYNVIGHNIVCKIEESHSSDIFPLLAPGALQGRLQRSELLPIRGEVVNLGTLYTHPHFEWVSFFVLNRATSIRI
jgi:hypothetical protein